jgi:hypothetical protein
VGRASCKQRTRYFNWAWRELVETSDSSEKVRVANTSRSRPTTRKGGSLANETDECKYAAVLCVPTTVH